MRKTLIIAATILAAASSRVQAQTDLTAYADANGYIDVQALTCAALAGTWQGDADRLTTWYSGWYNGLAKKHYFNIARSKELEHEVSVYCKANPQIRIIEAIDVMLKQEKLKAGFKSRYDEVFAVVGFGVSDISLLKITSHYGSFRVRPATCDKLWREICTTRSCAGIQSSISLTLSPMA